MKDKTILFNGTETKISSLLKEWKMQSYIPSELYNIKLPKKALPHLEKIFNPNLKLEYKVLEALKKDAKENLVKLAATKLPDPIGYACFAKESIREGEYFGYTGQLIINTEIKTDPTYVMDCTYDNPFIQVYLDAKNAGNVTRLIAYLPSQKTLSAYQFIGTHKNEIATANLEIKIYWSIIGLDVFFMPCLQAICNIPKNQLLGIDYGPSYWKLLNDGHGVEPVFLSQHNNLIDSNDWELKETRIESADYSLKMQVNTKALEENNIYPLLVPFLRDLRNAIRIPNHPLELASFKGKDHDFGYTNYLNALNAVKNGDFNQANKFIGKAIRIFPLQPEYFRLSYHIKNNLTENTSSTMLAVAHHLEKYIRKMQFFDKNQKQEIHLKCTISARDTLNSQITKPDFRSSSDLKLRVAPPMKKIKLENSYLLRSNCKIQTVSTINQPYLLRSFTTASTDNTKTTHTATYSHLPCGRLFKNRSLFEQHKQHCSSKPGLK